MFPVRDGSWLFMKHESTLGHKALKNSTRSGVDFFYFFHILENMNKEISWADFASVELRVGTIVRAEEFPEARKPAYKIWVDFGEEIGTKQSSAQITVHYDAEELI